MEIVQALIERDGQVTQEFFFKRCHNLFISIIHNVFAYHVDEDELINEAYTYLMENGEARLRQFQGRSTLLQWLKIVVTRLFIRIRDKIIEDTTHETSSHDDDNKSKKKEIGVTDSEDRAAATADLQRLLDQMHNQRYVDVICSLILNEEEPKEVADRLGIKVSALYNVKKRAMDALTKVALKDKDFYGKRH